MVTLKNKPIENPKWNMRYRFLCSHGFAHDASLIEFHFEDKTIILVAIEKGVPLNRTKNFALIVGDFESKEAALEFGKRTGRSLKVASVFAGIGVNIGKGIPTEAFAQSIKDENFKKSGLALYYNVHGLMYPPPDTLQLDATVRVSEYPDKFISGFKKAFSLNIPAHDDLEIPIDLYCASCMESSYIAKLILALSAIEYIAEQSKRPEKECRLIDDACNVIDAANTDQKAKENVKNLLRDRKKISIGQACRNLIENYLPNDLKEFRVVSNYRGKVAHPSSEGDRTELPDMASKAQSLTGRLIEKIICEGAG